MFDIVMLGKILLLLWIANGAPIIAARMLGKHLAIAIDFNYHLADRRRLFGKSKTWRGILAAILMTTPAAMLLGLGPDWGFAIAALAMSGDLMSSFIKRRLGLAASQRATLLDQIPEAFLPVLALALQGLISWLEGLFVVILFTVSDLLVSRVLYRLQIRKRPY
jgi:CDP-diglyceride synthetase